MAAVQSEKITHNKSISLVGGVFEAAMSTKNWRSFIDRVAAVLLEHGVSLLVQRVNPDVFRSSASDGFEPARDQSQDKVRLRVDLSRETGADSLRMKVEGGSVEGWKPVKGGDTGDSADSQTPVFVLGCFVSKRDARAVLMGVRWLDEVKPDEDLVAFLRSFVSQLQRAFALHKQFTQLRGQHSAISDVLNRLPFGVLFVDAHGHVVARNIRARQIAEESDGLVIDRSVLTASSAREASKLRELIVRATTAAKDEVTGAPMNITRPSMRRPLTVLVGSLTLVDKSEGTAAPAAVVFVADPEDDYDIAEETVLHFFDLTPAEARLLVALVNGAHLAEVSETFHVTKNTLKTQLNQIFRKTGTSRQADLIKLVYSTPVVMNVFPGQSH